MVDAQKQFNDLLAMSLSFFTPRRVNAAALKYSGEFRLEDILISISTLKCMDKLEGTTML